MSTTPDQHKQPTRAHSGCLEDCHKKSFVMIYHGSPAPNVIILLHLEICVAPNRHGKASFAAHGSWCSAGASSLTFNPFPTLPVYICAVCSAQGSYRIIKILVWSLHDVVDQPFLRVWKSGQQRTAVPPSYFRIFPCIAAQLLPVMSFLVLLSVYMMMGSSQTFFTALLR